MSHRRAAPTSLLQDLLQARSRVARDHDRVVRARAAMRIAWLGSMVAFGLVLLLGQAVHIMLLPDPQLESKARVQFEEAVEVSGRRGDLLARDGTVLATSVELMSLRADPARVDPSRLDEMASVLAANLGEPASAIRERLSRDGRRNVALARSLAPERARELVTTAPGGGLFLEPQIERYYPAQSDAVHLLGIAGQSGHGLAGVERTLDHELRGATQKYVLWRDRKGRRLTPEVPAVEPGNDVWLTIDPAIQRIAEDALDETMTRTGAEAAHAVVLDVHTGEILALANRPTLDPNDGASIDLALLKNRAVMDAFEPGSVFKPFIAAAALEEEIAEPDTTIDCEGGRWNVGRVVIHDDHPHGVVTLAEVIKYSSNIGTVKLAFDMGAETTLGYLHRFGFGRDTGLDLPGETRGFVRPAAAIKPIELATTSYGHGVTTNSVQLASAVATLGNGGVRMWPRIVREIRDARGRIVRSFRPEVDRRVVSEKTAAEVLAMMEMVTEQGGTGTRARVDGYRTAGKTGTAWKHENGAYSSTKRIGSWVGVIPADAPRLAIVVVVDTPTQGSRYGGIVAAPAFAAIGAGAMRVLGVPPSPPVADAEVAPAVASVLQDAPLVDDVEPTSVAQALPALSLRGDGALVAPDLAGLSVRDALAVLQGGGLAVRFEGTGRVAHQSPAPGSPVVPGSEIEVVLQQ